MKAFDGRYEGIVIVLTIASSYASRASSRSKWASSRASRAWRPRA